MPRYCTLYLPRIGESDPVTESEADSAKAADPRIVIIYYF